MTIHPPMLRSVTVRAPGRVNLIGEHIDYCGFGVLPCAISRSVQVSVSVPYSVPDDYPKLSVSHSEDTVKYSCRSLRSNFKRDESPHWSDYVLAAYMGICEYVVGGLESVGKSSVLESSSLCPIEVLVGGDIPPAAGLSSSSAVVVGVVSGLVRLFALPLSAQEIAALAADCERHAGVAGGGMDQSAILLSCAGFATHVEFFPSLSASKVKVPGRFVAAHCGVVSAKAVDATWKFNRRVLEVRLAAGLLSGGLKSLDKLPTFREVKGSLSFPECLQSVEDVLPQFINADDLIGSEHLFDDRMMNVLKHLKGDMLIIKRRAKHVFTEAQRVHSFIEAAGRDDFHEMGRLMNESDASCHDDYDCGCLELRELTDLMRSSGALGARLTGAGWGGFAIALVQGGDDDVHKFMNGLKEKFYEPRNLYDTADMMFEFTPSEGARIIHEE